MTINKPLLIGGAVIGAVAIWYFFIRKKNPPAAKPVVVYAAPKATLTPAATDLQKTGGAAANTL